MNPSFLELRALKFEPTHRNSISVNPEIFGLILLSDFFSDIWSQNRGQSFSKKIDKTAKMATHYLQVWLL